MELKDIVHDIEYGKKLKELGVKQDSIFYFTHISGSEKTWIKDGAGQKLDSINYNGKENIIRLSAFTSTELLEMLPEYILEEIRDEKMEHTLTIQTSCINGFNISYQVTTKYGLHYSQLITDKKLCNALAKCLIYLLENKLISIV